MLVLQSCASSSGSISNVDRQFLGEHKLFYLTYGEDNGVDGISMDEKTKYAYMSKKEGGNVDLFAIDTYSLKEYKLTKNPGIDTSPSINAAGKKLVFTSTRDDAFGDLYLFEFPMFSNIEDVAEAGVDNYVSRLTDHKGLDVDSQIARDKDLVVFVSDRWEGVPTIHTIELKKKAEAQRLTEMPSKMPTFSFDDSEIAFIAMESVHDNTSQLATINLATGNIELLTDTKTMKFNPSYYSKDVILYFEVRSDTDEDGYLTYADEKHLCAYSIPNSKIYSVQSPTTLTAFFTPYDSSAVGAYVDFKDEKANASIGNTKTFFIKDNDVNNMYKTFLSLPYSYQQSYIGKFDEYFPNDESNENNAANREVVAQANFNYLIITYMRGDYPLYLQTKQKILREYADTTIYDVVHAMEVLTGYSLDQNIERERDRRYINNIDDTSLYTNIEALKGSLSFLEEEDRYNTIWGRYIIASEMSKYESKIIPTYLVMENAVGVNLDSRTYISMVKLYIKLMIDADIPLTDRRYSMVYNRSDITYANMMDIAKYTVEYAIEVDKLDMDLILNNLNLINPISVAAKFAYINSLMITDNEALAHELFAEYMSKGDPMKASYNYAMAMIENTKNNDTTYDYLQKSLAYGSAFNDSEYGSQAKAMLAEYYMALANEAYDNREYNSAYNNYNAVLTYDPNNITASERRMETSLSVGISDNASSMNSIASIEKMVRNSAKNLLATRYSDANAHLEIATSYYYLANRYYSYAIANKTGKNRYHLQQKRRQDRFSLYLLKAFETIIGEAASAIDLAIFLQPENIEYYTFKAKLLATALTMRIEIASDGADEQSLLDLVNLYKDENEKTPRIDTISHYQLSSDTLEYDIYAALAEAKYQMKTALITAANTQTSTAGNRRNRSIDRIRVSEIADSDTRLSGNLEYSKLSLMLANAMVINGLYIEAVAEYENAKLYFDTVATAKETAWYNFFHAYCLWINSNMEEAIELYKKAYTYFKDSGDFVAKFRILGYLAVADIEAHRYYEAIHYLKEREKILTLGGEDSTLNDLLLATCYLKNEDYNNALSYCDKVRPVIESLDMYEYNDQYLSISVFGSVVPLVNMGLAAFGGYIPDEPLNIDKREMLYSLYQEIYEAMGDYQKARLALNEYRSSTESDKVKESLTPIFLGMYKNNEGALYYLEGNTDDAEKAFEQSIEQYYRAIIAQSKKDNVELDFTVNANNDAINYINLTYLYLNTIADTRASFDTKNQAFKKLNDILPILEVMSKSPNVEKRNILLLNSNIAAINYVFAKYSIAMLVPTNSIERHEQNLDRMDRIKDAIRRYNYILSGSGAFEYDGATEVILRYNLGLCFEFLQNTNEAAREYTAAYEKAKANNYILENIGILSTLLDFSKKYYQYNKDIIAGPATYAREMEALARDNIFAFSFYANPVLPLLIAKNNLTSYYIGLGTQTGVEKALEVTTLFDAIISRISLLKTMRLTHDDSVTDAYLAVYYSFYEEAYELNKDYQAKMAARYDAKIESEYIASLKTVERQATAALRNSTIKETALGIIDKSTIQNKLRSDEALIWDINDNTRILVGKNRIELVLDMATPTISDNIKNITYIGFFPPQDLSIGEGVYYRRLLTSYPFFMPNTHTLFDTSKFAVNIVDRSRSTMFTYSASDQTNTTMSLASEYDTNMNTLRSNIAGYENGNTASPEYINDEIYSSYMQYQEISIYSNEFRQLLDSGSNQTFMDAIYAGDLQSIQRELIKQNNLSYSPQTAKYSALTNAMHLPYIPFVLDFSNADSSLMSQFMRKSSYIAYIDRATFNSNMMSMFNVNPYVIIIGDGVVERAEFYTNYLNQLITNSVENVFRGVDPKKYQIYGLGVHSPHQSTNTINSYQDYLFDYYLEQEAGLNRFIAATNLINYLDTTNKKIYYYSVISEQMLGEANTNASLRMLNMAYSLFTNSTTNEYTSENARDFMTNTMQLYSKIEGLGAYSNSIRLMDYMDKYIDNHHHRNTVVDEYLKNPNDIFSFLTYETDRDNVIRYFESFMPYMDEDYRYKVTLAEYATIYRNLYAGRENARNATNEMNTYILNMLDTDRRDDLVATLDVLRRIKGISIAATNTNVNANTSASRSRSENPPTAGDSNSRDSASGSRRSRDSGGPREITEEQIFNTVNYIYSKPTVFFQETKILLFEHIYSKYSTNAAYMFGMLQKSVNNGGDLNSYIENMGEVFDSMADDGGKNVFVYYVVEDKQLQAYLYGGGSTNVQKFALSSVEQTQSLIDSYKSAVTQAEREATITSLQRAIVNRDMVGILEQASVENIYISGTNIIYEVPFMFFKYRSGQYFGKKNLAKVHRFAFASNDDDDNWLNIEPTVKFTGSGNGSDNFYHSLERQSVLHSFAQTGFSARYGIAHQIDAQSEGPPNFAQNNFISPIDSSTIAAYLKDGGASGVLLFTHKSEQRGDYYTTLKNLYRNMNDMDIVGAYQKALFEDRGTLAKEATMTGDSETLYGAYLMFDYVLPYVPKF